MSSDATAQVKVESTEILIQALAQLLDAVIVIDEHKRITYFNAAAERLFGMPAQAIVGQHVKALLTKSIRTRHDDAEGSTRKTTVGRLGQKGRERLIERTDGIRRRAFVSISRVNVAARTIYAAFLTDVSDEHDAHEQLSQTLEQILDAVVVIDERNRITFFNQAAESLWGVRRVHVLGKPAQTLIAPTDRAARDDLVDANGNIALEQTVGTSREFTIDRPDGEKRIGLLSLSRVRVGAHLHYTALIKDVTEQRFRDEHLRQLSMVVNESDNGIVVTGAYGRIVYVNSGLTRMLGYELGELRGKRPCEVFAGQHTEPDAANLVQQVRRLADPMRGLKRDILIYAKGGQPLWVSAVINAVRDDGGNIVNFLGVLTDITGTKMHEVLQHKVLDAIVQEMPVKDVMILLCHEVERVAPEVVASVLSLGTDGCLHTLAAPSLPRAVVAAIDGQPAGPSAGSCGTAAWRGEPVVATDIASDPLWADYRQLALPYGLLACWSSPIKAEDGTVIGTFAFYYHERRTPSVFHQRLVDLSVHLCTLLLERENNRARIHQLAFYDSLTGLPNRAMLDARTARALVEAKASASTVAVLFVDLNRFKQVNDSQGHAGGDQLLREFAQRFRATVRDMDIVDRLAGDEFLAVLPDCDVQCAIGVIEQLLAELEKPVAIFGATIHSSASIGVAMYPRDGEDVETLIHHADIAMYRAKTSGRSHYQFFSAEMGRITEEQALLEADLRDALEQDQLELHYQPQYLSSGRCSLYGVEALLRWHHPVLGDVAPMRFIPLAEACGLIGQLGAWVMTRACRQLTEWRLRDVPVPRIAVNLSASHFQDANLPDLVADTLRRFHLEARDLTLEMTEGVLLSDSPTVATTLATIHDLGIRLSLDDFGTGYSSLGYLHRLPFSELKLDKSFVQDLDHSDSARALVRSVLRIGESLAMTVVAEGVETEGQRRFLIEQGCPILQGYFFARPMPAAALERWFDARAAIRERVTHASDPP
jgi:diguanylate cyclase (GGDEF)-like protein/PAS domain S-box-containing protein